MVQIDEMNRRIIRLLKTDGNMTYQEIADKLRRSPSTVRDRIRRMEDTGIILSYATIIDMEKMGYRTDAIIMANYSDEVTQETLKGLKDIDGLTQAMIVSGDKRLMIRLHAHNVRELYETISDQLIPFGLKDIDVRVIIEAVLRFPGIAFPD